MAGGDGGDASKEVQCDRILQNLFVKVAQIILQSRVMFNSSRRSSMKNNNWFNLETEDIELIRDEIRAWKNDLYTPMHIEIALNMSKVSSSQAVVINGNVNAHSEGGGSARASQFVLEQWRLSIVPPADGESAARAAKIELPSMYKHLILMMRSLYAYLRLMPAHSLQRRCRTSKLASLCIIYQLSKAPLEHDMLGDGKNNNYEFAAVETPHGRVSLTVMYRGVVNVSLTDSERALSSRFIENYFDEVDDEKIKRERSRSQAQQRKSQPAIHSNQHEHTVSSASNSWQRSNTFASLGNHRAAHEENSPAMIQNVRNYRHLNLTGVNARGGGTDGSSYGSPGNFPDTLLRRGSIEETGYSPSNRGCSESQTISSRPIGIPSGSLGHRSIGAHAVPISNSYTSPPPFGVTAITSPPSSLPFVHGFPTSNSSFSMGGTPPSPLEATSSRRDSLSRSSPPIKLTVTPFKGGHPTHTAHQQQQGRRNELVDLLAQGGFDLSALASSEASSSRRQLDPSCDSAVDHDAINTFVRQCTDPPNLTMFNGDERRSSKASVGIENASCGLTNSVLLLNDELRELQLAKADIDSFGQSLDTGVSSPPFAI